MKNLIKKTCMALIVLLFAGFLAGCGEAAPVQNLQRYDGGDFTLEIDPTWKIINQSDFYAEIPQETLVAFTTPEAYNGFFINVNIVREDLKQHVSSMDYGRANINLSAQNLTDYQKIQETQIDVGGQSAPLHIFQARLNPTEKLIKFVQLYATKGNYGYIVSGGMLPDTPKEVRDLVGATVMSFRLK
ncbi:hypothetical protein JW752_03570 [Candidatus Peregrinibacteria bacterium]|nr:hypothetical protein [Candidatus Peregrinibacteria bacterium]